MYIYRKIWIISKWNYIKDNFIITSHKRFIIIFKKGGVREMAIVLIAGFLVTVMYGLSFLSYISENNLLD